MLSISGLARGFSLFLLMCFSQSGNAQGQIIDKIVAKIGDEYILLSDIQTQKLSLLQNNMDTTATTDCEILEGLLYEKLLIHQAILDSVEVGDEIVNQEMESRLRMIADQMGGDLSKLESFYGKSVAQIKATFFESIKKRMQAERMKSTIIEDIDITPKAVQTFYKQLPKDSIPYINSKVTLAQVVIYPQLTEVDRQRALAAIQASRNRVIKGERSFQTEAVLSSEDPGSRVQGGDLGWQTKGNMVPEFEAALFQLENDEVSPVFETQYGYHYLQMMDRRGDNYRVRHVLISPKVSKQALLQAKQKGDSIHTEMQQGRLLFEEAVRQFSQEESSVENGGKIVDPYSGEEQWDIQNINKIDPQISRLVNSLRLGDYSPASLFENYADRKQGVRIVKLVDKTRPHLANLKEDYQLIRTAALNKKKQAVIDEWVQQKMAVNYSWISSEYAHSCTFELPWVKKGSW